MTSSTLKVTTPTDREIVMTRIFDAPRALVFEALTKPALLKRWFLGPPGWTLAVCEIDLRVGGAYRYVWSGERGEMGHGRHLQGDRPARAHRRHRSLRPGLVSGQQRRW